MGMRERAIFFDIDGTLIGFDGVIPESAVKALGLAKENGHRLFICTGRPRCMVDERLAEYGFDGMICSSGAYLEYKGKAISEVTIPEERMKKLCRFFDSTTTAYGIQCARRTVYTVRHLEKILKLPTIKRRLERGQMEFLRPIEVVEDYSSVSDAEKALYYDSTVPIERIRGALAPEFEVVPSSFEALKTSSGEITQAEVTKAGGIREMTAYLDMMRKDVVAFGDSMNDLDMLKYAGLGIAMGNADDLIKSAADYVTLPIGEDGVYHALKHWGMV